MPSVEVRGADGSLIHTYEIIAAGYGTLTSSEHLLDIAKRNAIDDELVDEDGLDALSFCVVEG